MPPESVLSLDGWLRAAAAGGLLTEDLLLQQLQAIEATRLSAPLEAPSEELQEQQEQEQEQQQQQQQQQTAKRLVDLEPSPELRSRCSRLWNLLTLP